MTYTNPPAVCEICGCPIQRTEHGTVADGMAAHLKTVHPETQHPSQRKKP